MEVYGNKSWYLVQAKPRQHEKALRNLQSQEYECYNPTVSVKNNQFDDRQSHIEPLFPGYIFIKLSVDCNWMAISSTRGVNRFVRFGMYPTRISDEVLHRIDKNLSKYGSSINYSRKLRPGDLVNIESDGFANLECIFKCSVGNHRSVVLIKLLEKTREFIFETKHLKKA